MSYLRLSGMQRNVWSQVGIKFESAWDLSLLKGAWPRLYVHCVVCLINKFSIKNIQNIVLICRWNRAVRGMAVTCAFIARRYGSTKLLKMIWNSTKEAKIKGKEKKEKYVLPE